MLILIQKLVLYHGFNNPFFIPGSDICPPLKAPVNGAVSYYRPFSLAQASCKSGFYPEGKMAFLYICVNNKWKDTSPTNAPVPIPDCLCTYAKLTLRRQSCFFPIFQTSTMGLKMLFKQKIWNLCFGNLLTYS